MRTIEQTLPVCANTMPLKVVPKSIAKSKTSFILGASSPCLRLLDIVEVRMSRSERQCCSRMLDKERKLCNDVTLIHSDQEERSNLGPGMSH
jgi:hypothetical protein